ncbi:hypothetical protein ABFX02_01G014500 [Erythranthe guttata]
MAEEAVYASSGGEQNKRKYEDSPPPVARRATGFSSAPDSAAPPPSYKNVPPPMSEIELAKQRAQEIAARLLNDADPSKRARGENGGGFGGGFDAIDAGIGQKHLGLGLSTPPQSASYGYPGPNKRIEIPNGRVGVIIGKGGETIKYLQLQSGAKIQVTRDMDSDPNSTSRGVELTGTPDQIAKAEQLISDVLSEAESGGSSVGSRRSTGQPFGAEQFVMKVPNNKVGLVIGKGGETIKSMQATTGARIQVIPLHLPPGDNSLERTVQIDGSSEQIEAAKLLVEEVTSENRMRNNNSMSGGYSQQGYQARAPTNWTQNQQQPGSGYGYVQPGAYPGPPQYSQPPYSGYPPQPTTGWDQSTAPPQNQGAAQGGNYDYYNQQQQQQTQGAPTDGSNNYGYGPGYGQGYGQDGYGGGYQAQSGYDQQGYNNSTYANAPNPTPDAQTQGETNQTTPPGQSYNHNYPHQTSSQPGYGSSQGGYGTQAPPSYASYGAPQPQNPGTQPTYAQPQQSPGAQYAQYPPSSDSSAQRPPSSGYAAASQTGYGAPPAGGYAPPPYSNSYGGAYSQPPAYSSDGNARGGAATHDVTPPQAAHPSGAAKASPPS